MHSKNELYRLQMIMMGQCKFINYNKHTTLFWILIMGEAVYGCGQKVSGKSLYFLLCLAMNLKLL